MGSCASSSRRADATARSPRQPTSPDLSQLFPQSPLPPPRGSSTPPRSESAQPEQLLDESTVVEHSFQHGDAHHGHVDAFSSSSEDEGDARAKQMFHPTATTAPVPPMPVNTGSSSTTTATFTDVVLRTSTFSECDPLTGERSVSCSSSQAEPALAVWLDEVLAAPIADVADPTVVTDTQSLPSAGTPASPWTRASRASWSGVSSSSDLSAGP